MRWSVLVFVLVLLASAALGMQEEGDDVEVDEGTEPEDESRSVRNNRIAVKDSVCPSSLAGDSQSTTCEETCVSDDDCDEGDTCCFNGCGHQCRPQATFQVGENKPMHCTKRCRRGATCTVMLDCKDSDCRYNSVCVRRKSSAPTTPTPPCGGKCKSPNSCVFKCNGIPFKCSWRCASVDLSSDVFGGFSNFISSMFSSMPG